VQRIRYALLAIIVALSGLWLAADPILWTEYEFFAWRAAFIGYTGIVGMGAMSLAMLLALRPLRLEPLLGGLDKSYRLHKWLGITGLILSVAHFLLTNIPKLILEPDALEASAPSTLQSSNPILAFFMEQRGLAEEFGDWGFKVAVVLIAIALIKWFPYRFFFQTHRLLSLVYLFLVFHSIVLMDSSYWGEIIGPLISLLMVAGTIAAIISLLGRIGTRRRAVGEIERLHFHEDNRVLKIGVKMIERWAGHEEGQFAFVTFDRKEGKHPFSIASPWTGDGRIGFFVKGLGDYTITLPETLKVGDLVTVEGPYGMFDFDGERLKQVWIAGGIGVAPFASRLKALMTEPDDKEIEFFYSASPTDDTKFLDRIKNASEAAGVRLHITHPDKDDRLDAKKICEVVPDWDDADFWFCGPTGFGDALRDGFVDKGLPEKRFHRELFDMR